MAVSPPRKDVPLAQLGLGLMMLLIIGLYVGLGRYASPMSDDFSHAISLQKLGFWPYFVKGYTSWYGIYSGWLWIGSIASLFDLFWLAKWQPLFQVTFSLTAIFVFLSAFKQGLSLSTRVWLTAFVQAAWFSITEGLPTYFYWTTASMIYYGGNTLTVLQAACVVRIFQPRYPGKAGMTAMLSLLVFVSAGFAADVAVMQVLAYAGLAIACRWQGLAKDSRRMAIITGIALVGFGLVYFSPATKIRMQTEAAAYGTSPQNVVVTLKIAARYGLVTAAAFLSKPILYLAVLFMPLLARGPVIPLRSRVRAWHIFAILVGVSCFYQALHGWSRGEELPERMIARVYWNMAALWSLFWVFLYRNPSLAERIEKHRLYRKRYLLLAACLLLNSNSLSLLQSHTTAVECAGQLEARYRYIASQKTVGNLELTVPGLTVPQKLFPCADITGNRENWVNKALAEYLGLRSIRSVKVSAEADADLAKLQSLAEADDPRAAFAMAQLYDPRIPPLDNRVSEFSASEVVSGSPPAKNPVPAFRWYLKAAHLGHNPAQRFLVGIYATGLGVERSYGEAIRWFLISRNEWLARAIGL
jgi:hypothetical protein